MGTGPREKELVCSLSHPILQSHVSVRNMGGKGFLFLGLCGDLKFSLPTFFLCALNVWFEKNCRRLQKNVVLLIHNWGVLKLALQMCSNSMQIETSTIEELERI